MLNITLFVPGLFDVETELEGGQADALAMLELLLGRGHRTANQDASYHADLCRQFDYTPAAGEDIPVASIGRLLDDDKRPEGFWMRADPVHLRADAKSLSLLDSSSFSLTQHDALALAACVQQSINDLGWELEVPVPTRWYVKLDSRPSIRTREIQDVVGKDIRTRMPEGDDAVVWHRLMNEIQMQLHSAEINQLRIKRGELPINSLWLWGTGELPDLLERRWSRVYSNDNIAMGLSMLSNTPCFPTPVTAEAIFNKGGDNAEVLVVLPEFQSTMLPYGQRGKQLQQFEINWCRYLLQQLRQGKLGSIRIVTRAWEFKINKTSLLKFWKRAKTFNSYIA